MPATAPQRPPRRPWQVWAVCALLISAAALAITGLVIAMWRSITDYAGACWLMSVSGFAPSDPRRVLPAIGIWVIAVTAAGLACFTATQVWSGRRWSRWFAVGTLAASLLALMIGPLASSSIAPAALGAALTFIAPFTRFCDAMDAARHPEAPVHETPKSVHYGPLPRYLGAPE